jgi:radical SAM enzyme (rSAM/lipoprotein system)
MPASVSLGVKKRLTLELLRSYKKQQARLHPLSFLLWECTLRCDLACAHCGSDCRAESATPDMPLKDFMTVLREIAGQYPPESVTVGLTGGEPLLRPDLEDCGAAIRSLGFPWGMVSNGYSLTRRRFESLMRSGLGSLSLSLDGLEASHESLRGRAGAFARTLGAIELAASAASEARLGGGPRLAFDVVTCANKANLEELPRLRELLMERGVRRWRIFSIFPRGRATGQDWLSLSPREYHRLMDRIVEFRESGGIEVDYACEGFLGPYEGEARGYYYFCRSGINFASILADGSITGCTSMRRDFIQGNIYNGSFLGAWDRGFGALRDRSWTRIGPCASCRSYRYCEGNGLHLWAPGAQGPMRCNLGELFP